MKRILLLPLILTSILSCGSSGGGSSGGGGSTANPTPIAPSIPFNPSDPHNVEETRNEGYDGTGVTVGIIDTRFEVNNAEFKDSSGVSRLSEDVSFAGVNNIHGSLVAEVIGGNTIGMAPDVKMLGAAAGAVCSDGTSRCIVPKVQMYEDLYNSGIRIFNQSFGVDSLPATNAKKSDFPLTDPVINFYNEKATTDSLFIWANGNAGGDQPQVESGLPYLYPQLEKGWIAVAAVDSQTGLISDYSNKCGVAQNWCVAAVGDYTFNVSNVTGEGTSFASPAVTGAAALVQQKYPWMNGDLIRQTILSTATDKGAAGVDAVYGWGLLNASKAVKGPALFDKRLALGDYVNVSFDNYTSTFSNDISGDAGLVKSGNGTLILSGNNTYTGKNIVNAGVLKVNGQVISQVDIQSNGILSSDGGTIKNNVVNYGGTLRNEGNGTTIHGNYLLSSEAVTEHEMGADFKVYGKVVLNNSRLYVKTPKTDKNFFTYINSTEGISGKVLNASEGIENTFGSVIVPVLLNSEITQDTNNIELKITRKNVAEFSEAEYNSDSTRNSSSKNLEKVFQVLDTNESSELFRAQAAVIQQSASSSILAATLDSLSGQIYASAQALTFQQMQAVNKDLSNRLSMIEYNDDRGGLWFNALGGTGQLYESGYAKADTYFYGGQLGIDKNITDNAVLGVTASFTEARADFDRYAGKSKSQNLGLSLYGKYNFGDENFYLLGRLGAAYISSNVDREVVTGGYTEKLSVDHDDYAFSGYGEFGYKFMVTENIGVKPFAGLSYESVRRGSFSEEDSLFGLKADSKTYNQGSGLVGIKADTVFDWVAGKTTLQSYLTWQGAFNDEDLSFEAAYTGMPDQKFKVEGIGLSNNTTWFGIGALTEVTPAWSWYANYDMQIAKSRIMNNVFSVGARYSFQ
jgi:autotransporter-associated beta strand protein